MFCLLCEILWSSSPSDSDIFVRNVRLGAEIEREVSHQNFFLLVRQIGPSPASMLGVISPLYIAIPRPKSFSCFQASFLKAREAPLKKRKRSETARPQFRFWIEIRVNSLTPKSIPAGTKLVLFGRYVLNIYVGIVRYFLRTTKTQRAKIYLPTQRTNRRISYDIN